MYRNLTLHILTPVSYSNLNRDDSGVPKRIYQGGALRAMHSSQSIKKGDSYHLRECLTRRIRTIRGFSRRSATHSFEDKAGCRSKTSIETCEENNRFSYQKLVVGE